MASFLAPLDIIFSVLLLPGFAHAYSSGAGTGACGTLIPSHSGSPQTSTSPFVVLLSKNTYVAGETIDVTLEARCGAQFKGFLVQARRADPAADTTELIGSFTAITDTKNFCANGGGDTTLRGLTHTSAALKTTITIQWTAPTPATGHIFIKSTFVQSENTYWVGVTSEVLNDNTAGALSQSAASLMTATMAPCTTSDTPATTPSTTGLSRDSACGTSLGCFDNCDTGCTFTITWAVEGNNIRFRLSTLSSGNSWIAVGFSSDTTMGADSVSECVVFGGVVRAFQSYNVGYSNSRLASPEDGISDVSGSVTNGVFSCSFLRVTGGTADSQSFNLSLDWFLLAAWGSANSGFSKSKHSVLPTSTATAVDLQAFSVSGATILEFPLVKAHGSLMCLAWLFFAGVGLVIARSFKTMWPDKTLGGTKIWFQVHRGCMIATLLSTVISFIIIFVEAEGYSQPFNKGIQNAHPILGIIVTVLVIVNPVMALFRPAPDADNRPIFNWAHLIVGNVAHILAVITTFFGMTMSKANVPEYTQYILAAYCVWQIGVEIALEIVRCVTKQPETEKVADSSLQIQDSRAKSKSNFATINMVILGLHVVVLAALTFTLIGILAAA